MPPPAPEGDETLRFNYPGSDIILRSRDSYEFPLPKLYIVLCSPVLRDLIESVSNTSDVPNGEDREAPSLLPVVERPKYSEILWEILFRLLTFISPATPSLPLTAKKITVSNGEQPLPVFNVPESKETLYCLLTFVFPVTPTPSPPRRENHGTLGRGSEV